MLVTTVGVSLLVLAGAIDTAWLRRLLVGALVMALVTLVRISSDLIRATLEP